MKRKDARNILDRFLNRLGTPPTGKMEAAGERVLLQLKLQSSQSSCPANESILEPDPVRPVWKPRILVAAAVILAVVIPATLLRNLIWPGGGRQAAFEASEGARKIQYGETVRSNDTAGAVVVLPDGSRVEMRSQSELALERADDGLRIRLAQGSVIVTAAKQGAGHLYVQTKDITVSVVGTVFLVNAEIEGSRVAVIQGEVRVQQGAVLKNLLPGEQVATNPVMQTVPMIEEIQWSRDAMAHLALLQQALVIPPVIPQPPPPATPQFDVVSIKPCGPFGPGGRGGPGGDRGGGGGGIPVSSNGRLVLPCGPIGNTMEQLIRQAYLTFANGQRNPQIRTVVLIDGGPPWINMERYEITATTSANVSEEMMKGPMLQAVLEDRFKLKIHRETREIPVFAMTVLKSGFKLQPLEEGSCEPLDPKSSRPMRMTPDGFEEFLRPGQKPGCGLTGISSWGAGDLNQTVFGKAMGLTQFAFTLSRGLDRPVVDKTGITGIFNLRLRFAGDQATERFLPPARPGMVPPPPPPEAVLEPAGPSIFTAIQEQLGLRLDPARGPGEFIVIDHVEKPSEN